jgi:hypothetical protein
MALALSSSIMSTSGELVRVALLALVTGLAVPLLVQLFITLRGLRRTAEALERRLDVTLKEIGDAVADLRRSSSGPSALGATLAAAGPVILAAVRAFRSAMHEGHHPVPSPQSENHTKETRS